MKIIMSSPNYFWDIRMECMEEYKKNKSILVLLFENVPEENKQGIEGVMTIDVHKHDCGLGQYSGTGRNDRMYMEVEKHLGKILAYIEPGEDVLVLSDIDPRSVIVYDLLKRNTDGKNFKLHFWGVVPFRFESRKRKESYMELLDGIGRVKSLCLLYADEFLETVERRSTLKQVLEKIKVDLGVEFPKVVKAISDFKPDLVYFFDRCTKRYIDASLSLEEWKKENSQSESYQMGETIFHYDSYANDKKLVEQLMIRDNGKNICRELRKMRIDFAKTNGIDFTSIECGYEGPCAGTCEKCDSELKYLSKMINSRPDYEVIYPSVEIESRAEKQMGIRSNAMLGQLKFRSEIIKENMELQGIQIPGFLKKKIFNEESADE